LEDELQEHKDIACESLQYYKEMKQKCCEQWKEVTTSDSKSDKFRWRWSAGAIEALLHSISADYQMQKLVPYWGSSPQPGSTYYFQTLMISSELLTTGMIICSLHLWRKSGLQNSRPYHLLYPPVPQISR